MSYDVYKLMCLSLPPVRLRTLPSKPKMPFAKNSHYKERASHLHFTILRTAPANLLNRSFLFVRVMEAFVDAFEVWVGHVRINLRRSNVAMAEHGLYRA